MDNNNSRNNCNRRNNINHRNHINHKNHGTDALDEFIAHIDLGRVTYLHVAGHEFDERFKLYIDTHSQPVEPPTAAMARRLLVERQLPVLLEWDNDLPDLHVLNQELTCLRPLSTTT